MFNILISKRAYFYWEQGLRSSENTRLPQMWPGFDSRIWRHIWVEFVGSCSCSDGFSLDTPVFPSPQKPILSNSNLIWWVFPHCKAHLITSSLNNAQYKFANLFTASAYSEATWRVTQLVLFKGLELQLYLFRSKLCLNAHLAIRLSTYNNIMLTAKVCSGKTLDRGAKKQLTHLHLPGNNILRDSKSVGPNSCKDSINYSRTREEQTLWKNSMETWREANNRGEAGYYKQHVRWTKIGSLICRPIYRTLGVKLAF